MSYIQLQNPENSTGKQKELFNQIESAFGAVPNMFKTIGNSPAALEAMFGFFGALGSGKINAKLGEKIAVLVANINSCGYCLAAHTALGQKAGATAEEMSNAQAGNAGDSKTQAALDFAKEVVQNRANIGKGEVENLKNAGFSDEEIAEILAHIALNIFTNYTNVAFDVPIDFPEVEFVPVG